MRPIFTLHAGEYLVGEYLEKTFKDCRVIQRHGGRLTCDGQGASEGRILTGEVLEGLYERQFQGHWLVDIETR